MGTQVVLSPITHIHRMALPSSAEVLVVGAGPAGMCLALALQKQGCPGVVVVDGALQGENTSRAIAIHAATIEVRIQLHT